MGSLVASGEDVKRWMREWRWDILQWVEVIGGEDDPFGDLWVDEERQIEAVRCPFVRKDRNRNTYHCRIYETRPQVCRNYEPWAPGSICEDVAEPTPALV
jgi:Fe-S-cluster containining protein